MSCGIQNVIEELIERIVANHETDWLARMLERQGYLSYQTLRAIRDDPSASWQPELENALFQMYAQVSPLQATLEIVHSEGMAALLNQLMEDNGHTEKVGPDEKTEKLVRQALRWLGVPSYHKPSRPPGLGSTLANLQEIHRGLLAVKRGRAKDLYALQGFTLSGWANIERLLEMTIRFYVRHFFTVSVVADPLRDSFEQAAEQKSLGPILHGFAAINSIFEYGETEYERNQRKKWRETRLADREMRTEDKIRALRSRVDRELRLGRSETKIKEEIEQEIRAAELDLQAFKEQERDEEQKIAAEKRELASLLRDECRHDFGRDSPFEGFVGITERGSIPSRYRNDYAHLPIAELYEKHDLKGALDSVQKALNLINDLRDNRIAPQTVVMVGLGQDCYGRELIYFVDESQIAEDAPIVLDQVGAMYKEHSFYEPFTICLMYDREDWDNICNPIIYYLEDVME